MVPFPFTFLGMGGILVISLARSGNLSSGFPKFLITDLILAMFC